MLDDNSLYNIDNQLNNLVAITDLQNNNTNSIGNEFGNQVQMLCDTNNHINKTLMRVDDAYLSTTTTTTKKKKDFLQDQFKIGFCKNWLDNCIYSHYSSLDIYPKEEVICFFNMNSIYFK